MKQDSYIFSKNSQMGRVVESIQFLSTQVKQVLNDVDSIKAPRFQEKITEVVVDGMGGSNLGAELVKAVFADRIKVPISITPGYNVPAHVGKNTLYVISSYSGDTEEPLSVYKEVKKRGARIIAITSKGNGQLEKLMKRDNIPGYIFKPEFNPSNEPRFGLGYMIFGTAVMLAKAGLFKIKVEEIKNVISSLELYGRKLGPAVKTKDNRAKAIAFELFEHQPVLVGADFLLGNLCIMRNQLCENSKNFASYLTLPESNHYALESLANPKDNKKNLFFFFFDSKLYHPHVQVRSELTKQIVRKNKIRLISQNLAGETKLDQALETLQIGTWITFYLAILNKVNPAEIHWVDWLKEKLKQ